jgi:hypothetical protein
MWAADAATLDEAMRYFLDLVARGSGRTSVAARLGLSGLVVRNWWNLPEWRAERAKLLDLFVPDEETAASLARYAVPTTVAPGYAWDLLRSGRGLSAQPM